MATKSKERAAADFKATPSFIEKTYEIFMANPYLDCCGWGVDGKTIEIKNVDVFSTHILPLHFKHSKFQSFVRQLHIYDFHKTSTSDPSHVGYANEFFRRGEPELLAQIKRKVNPPKLGDKSGDKAGDKVVATKSKSAPAKVQKSEPLTVESVEPMSALHVSFDTVLDDSNLFQAGAYSFDNAESKITSPIFSSGLSPLGMGGGGISRQSSFELFQAYLSVQEEVADALIEDLSPPSPPSTLGTKRPFESQGRDA